MTNYRPNSIFSVISKIMEKVLCQPIRESFELHDLLTKNQFGFRLSKNTSYPINEFLETVYKCSDASSSEAQVMVLEFSKVINTFNHYILLCKLEFLPVLQF
mgnify:CR=1 FL=1